MQRVRKAQFTTKYTKLVAGGLVDIPFFVATEPCKVTKVTEVHEAAETTAVTLTAMLKKATGAAALIGAGTDLLNAAVDLKGAANTLVTPALSAVPGALSLIPGDRLGFAPEAAGTEIADLVMTVTLEYE